MLEFSVTGMLGMRARAEWSAVGKYRAGSHTEARELVSKEFCDD